MSAVRTLSILTQRREVAKIELQNFASLRDSLFFALIDHVSYPTSILVLLFLVVLSHSHFLFKINNAENDECTSSAHTPDKKILFVPFQSP